MVQTDTLAQIRAFSDKLIHYDRPLQRRNHWTGVQLIFDRSLGRTNVVIEVTHAHHLAVNLDSPFDTYCFDAFICTNRIAAYNRTIQTLMNELTRKLHRMAICVFNDRLGSIHSPSRETNWIVSRYSCAQCALKCFNFFICDFHPWKRRIFYCCFRLLFHTDQFSCSFSGFCWFFMRFLWLFASAATTTTTPSLAIAHNYDWNGR